MSMTGNEVVVVGAGAVGLCAALFLQAEGCTVTIVDRAEPGRQTSSGNAGIISVQSTEPTGTPEVLRRLPALLADSQSPVRVRRRDLPWTASWLVAFAMACTSARSAAAARAQIALCSRSGSAWRILLQRTGADDRVTWPGWLKLAETPREAASLAAGRAALEAAGHDHAWLDAAGVAELEPALSPRFAAGLWLKANGQIDRPHLLLSHFTERFVADGGRVERDDVRDIRPDAEGVDVFGARRSYRADQVVLAAGPWAASLARRLGCRVPLVAERGYHLMLPQRTALIGRPLYAAGRGFVLAPMGPFLRLAFGAEIARLAAPADERRIRALLPVVRRWLPAADDRVESSWLGARPSTPDSLPVIGPSPRSNRVILAFGHNHLGLTQAPITGRLVADLARGRTPEVDLVPFRAAR
ncbi:MAG: FAD-dependent oxidoreductase [Pseudomonadota bacterium]